MSKLPEPECDTCGTLMEDCNDWCGECGSCRAHCAGSVSCRLWHLRIVLDAECISWGELAELHALGVAGLIPEWDVQLAEAAGLPEFPDDNA
jgi:hypothetical protein